MERAHSGDAPAAQTTAPPPAPAGATSSAVASAASATAGATALAILGFLLLLPCLRYGRLRLAPARWRPVVFVSLLERPG
jgi:hypothetical protein